MFLELHLEENDNKIMLNIDRIQSIYQAKGSVYIYIGESIFRVKESYEDIVNRIDKYYEIQKVGSKE